MKSRNTGDWVIAALVVICSGILFAALAFALSGASFGSSGRTVQVHFEQAMGVSPGTQVRYAGALAGTVGSIHMRSMEERLASNDPQNAIAITLNLLNSVPPLPSDIKVVISSDTLLSDKMVLLKGGNPSAPTLAANAILQGEAPVTFDHLIHTANGTLESLNHVMGGTGDQAENVFAQVRAVLTQTQSLLNETQALLSEAKPVISDAHLFVTEAREVTSDARLLVTENRDPLRRSLVQLESTATSLERLVQRGNSLIQDNEKSLTSSITNFRVTSQNLKITSTYAKFLLDSLARRPSQLLWGTRRPPPLPTEEEILSTAKPIPLN